MGIFSGYPFIVYVKKITPRYSDMLTIILSVKNIYFFLTMPIFYISVVADFFDVFST